CDASTTSWHGARAWRSGDNFLRAGQFGKRRVRLGLIPIGHAVIEVAALEWRRAVSLLDEESNGLVEHYWVGDVPAICGGIRFFKKRDAEIREASGAQPIGFAEIVFGPGALHFLMAVNVDDFVAFTPPAAVIILDA